MKLTMQLGSRSYDIILKSGCLANLYQFANVANRKVFILTDSGVPEQYAQTVLDTLDRYNVKITFFVTGNFAKGHPDIVQQFVARGHEIGNHSYHHVHLLTAGLKEIWEEVAPANDLLEQVAGVRPTLYRPPYGNSHGRIRAVVEGSGLKVIRWSHSLNDSDDTNQVASRSFACATAGKRFSFACKSSPTISWKLRPKMLDCHSLPVSPSNSCSR